MKKFLVVLACVGLITGYYRKDIGTFARNELDRRLYLPEIRAAADSVSMDPLFLTAIVFVESKFEKTAVSASGAHGLMQLMPSTALQVAKENKIRDSDLFDPKTNLRLGSLYLNDLLKEFADTHLAVAAYNGGPNAVKEWLRDSDGDTDIEKFGKKETRKYVKSVDKTYQKLRRLSSLWNWIRPYVD